MNQSPPPEKKKKSRLAAHFRNINILLLIFTLVVVTSLSAFVLIGITDNASKDYARFYSAELVEILGSYLNKELPLVQYAARSGEVADWFADEENPEKKAAAFREMMKFADFLQIGSVYFVIHESLNEYSVDSGARFEDFIHFNTLDPYHFYDQWYFNSINSEYDYTLNLDVDKITNTRRLWINHKVTKNGEILGVFCSALQFDDIFYKLFGRHDSRNIMGLIIDNNGLIKMDSFIAEPELLRDPAEKVRDLTRTSLSCRRHITHFCALLSLHFHCLGP